MKTAIILAAGEGTRMKSKKPKVMHGLLNKPMIQYVLGAAKDAGVDERVVVVGRNREQIESVVEEEISLVTQEIGDGIPYGTGYAVRLAVEHLESSDTILVLTGDTPLIRSETLRELVAFHEKGEYSATVLSATIDDVTGYGRIVRSATGEFLRIVEEKDADEEEKKIHEFNSGIFAFDGGDLKNALEELTTDNKQGEMYLTQVIEILRGENKKVAAFCIDDETEVYGINSKDQLSEAEEILRMRVNRRYMQAGVVMENPRTIFIEDGVKIGRDTEIQANVRIVGETVIGEDCIIGSGSVIDSSVLGDRVVVRSSVIEFSTVGNDTDIGPFSHLRPKASLGSHVHIGNFVEVKNAILDDGVKAGHLAYIGDADVGKDVNISCGVIFCNYDGVKKYRSTIEEGAFLGSNANIISPIVVGKEAYLAAGSTVAKDIEAGALAVERSELRQFMGWTEKKKKRDVKKQAETEEKHDQGRD